jgi:hypothetical protein
VPLSATVWGELLALLSATFKVAVRVPAAEGVKVTRIEQLPPALMPDWQLLVWLKSPALAPVMVMLGGFKATVPVSVAATFSGVLGVPTVWLGKIRFVLPSSRVPVDEVTVIGARLSAGTALPRSAMTFAVHEPTE